MSEHSLADCTSYILYNTKEKNFYNNHQWVDTLKEAQLLSWRDCEIIATILAGRYYDHVVALEVKLEVRSVLQPHNEPTEKQDKALLKGQTLLCDKQRREIASQLGTKKTTRKKKIM